MERCRQTLLSLVIAASLAGCTELRWCRDGCCCCCGSNLQAGASVSATSDTATAGKTDETKEGGAKQDALSIPQGTQARTPVVGDKQSAATKKAEPKSAPPTGTLPVSFTTKRDQAAVVTADATSEASPESLLRLLHRRAQQKFESINAYEMRMRRREVVGGKSKPEELIEARFRREPFSVYFKWVGPEAKGREVVYVRGDHGDLIHTLTAKNDVPLMPAGMRFKVAPDSPMVKGKSRVSITEAGLGSLIDRFGKLVDAVERGDARHGTAKPLGAFKRIEFEQKVEGVMQTIPPGTEPLLPGGGQRLWCFDIEHGLPVLILTHDEHNREVEYCCHDRFAFPMHLGDEAFDPDVLWRK